MGKLASLRAHPWPVSDEPCVDMPCANCAASVYPGPFVPLGRRGRWSSCGVIIALMSALVSPSTLGRSRKVVYHLSESVTVLQPPTHGFSELLLEVTFERSEDL